MYVGTPRGPAEFDFLPRSGDMNVNPDDYSANSATTGRLKVGGSVDGSFENALDSDWFAIDLQANTNYLFALTRTATYAYHQEYSALALYDANSTLLVPQSYGMYADGPVINFTPGASGTYFIAANLFDYGGGGSAYALSARVRTGADDYPASASTSGVLLIPGTLSATFEVAGDHDWFKFHVDAGSHYVIGMIAPDPSLPSAPTVYPSSIVIVDAAGVQLNMDPYGFDPTVSGDYYLDVQGLKEGSYALASRVWTDDFPANNNTLGRIVPGGEFASSIDYEGDIDRVKVTLDAAKFYTFAVTGESGYFRLGLFDAKGTRMTDTHGINVGNSGDGFIFQPNVAGDYFLDVARLQQNQAQQSAVAYTVTLSSGTADDIGGTPATARGTSVGAVASGSLQAGTDVDMFKVALEAGTTYAFALAPNSDVEPYLMLSLSDVNGVAIAQAINDAHDYYTFTPSRSGDYFAAIGAFGGVSPNRAYSLDITSAPDDFGANPARAGTLAIGAGAAGTLERGGGDLDWFAVNLDAGTTYWFSARSDSSTFTYGGQLRLLDPSGNPLALTQSTSYGVIADTLPFMPSKSGTYFLELSSPRRNTGAYSVAAAIGERDDFGQTPATAGALTAAAPLSGKLEYGADKDMFKIGVVAGVTYDIIVTAANNVGLPQLTLVDSAGAAVESRTWTDQANPSNQHTLFAATATGEVYATVAAGYRSDPVSYVVSETVYGVDDFSGDAKTSAVLPIGGSLQASLSNPLDSDWIRVHLESGKSYVFELLGESEGAGTLKAPAAARFSLFDAGNVYSGSTFGTMLTSGIEPRLGFIPSASGDYFLSVGTGYAGAMGSYTVKAFQLTGDTIGPALLTASHAPGATKIALTDTTITLTFSEPITIDASVITLKDSHGTGVQIAYGSSTGAHSPYVDGTQLVVKVQGIFRPDTYTLSIAHTALHDLAGNQHTGPETISFSTILPVTTGTSGDDLFLGGTGAAIDGGAGIDTVYYRGSLDNGEIRRDGANVTVLSYSTGKTDTLVGVERLLSDLDAYALDIDGAGGQAYRLYQAAFNRRPDSAGLGFWIANLDHGMSLHDVARSFVASPEFKSQYGAAPSDADFINLLYNNVLHRPAEASGFDFWENALHNGLAREDALAMFSESPENQAALAGLIGNGFHYTPY
jgi:methionine-rich copper-binding protein CopC